MKKVFIIIFVISNTLISLVNIFSQEPGTIKWIYKTRYAIDSTPAIGKDNTIYFTSHDSLFAINTDGSIKWHFVADGIYASSPAISEDGTIYIGSGTSINPITKVYAINNDGSLRWSFSTDGYILGSPAIGNDGTVYIGSQDKKIYAIDPDGELKWEFSTRHGWITSSPGIDQTGNIYVGARSSWSYRYLYALNQYGELKWTFNLENVGDSSPAIDNDGNIYIGSKSKKLFSINPDGTLRWFYKMGDIVMSSPSIDSSGTIYVGSNDHNLYAINHDGTLKWMFNTGSPITSSPTIGENNIIYIFSAHGMLYAINPDGTPKWELQLPFIYGSGFNSSPAIAEDGTLYIGTERRDLYAIYTDSKGLAKSSWPKFRANILNTGAMEFDKNIPIAEINEDSLTIDILKKVILDGSSSYDPDDDPLYYLWKIESKPEGSEVNIENFDNPLASIFLNYSGEYKFSLTVTDSSDGMSKDEIVIKCNGDSLIKWIFKTQDTIYGIPAIDDNNNIYIGSMDDNLYAISPEGNKLWFFDTENDIRRAPLIDESNHIYVLSGDDNILCIDQNGTEIWRKDLDNHYNPCHLALGSDGIIYCSTDSSNLTAITPDGNIKWKSDALTSRNIYDFAPIISTNGKIFSGIENYILFVDQFGNIDKILEFPYTISSPATDEYGNIYTGTNRYPYSSDNYLFAIHPSGHEKWHYPKFLEENWQDLYDIITSPIIGFDGTVYITTAGSELDAIRKDGHFLWRYEFASGLGQSWKHGGIAIGQDSTIFLCRSNRLYRFSKDGTLIWSIDFNTKISSPPSIGNNGCIYFGLYDGNLMSIQTDCKGLADSPWPKFRHDNKNTGNINTTITKIDHIKASIPKSFILYQNYPNPFNSFTTIQYEIPKPCQSKLFIYNILGQRVITTSRAINEPGKYSFLWDGKNEFGESMSTGIYFCKIQADKFSKIIKIMLLQ